MDLMFFVLVFLFIFLLLRKTPSSKGKRGERDVFSELKKLDSKKYKIINDLLLKLNDGKTSQIDHVVVSIYGIFVIETKNYSGWIFGKDDSENWMQIIYKTRNSFRNPIKQNWSHIYALKECLKDFSNVKYIPIVVFSDKAELKNIQAKTSVVYTSRLLTEINNQSIEENLSDNDMLKITEILISLKNDSKIRKTEHIRNIKENISEQNMKQESLICPRCNSELVLRQSKYGYFYGCKNYPRCKFKTNF